MKDKSFFPPPHLSSALIPIIQDVGRQKNGENEGEIMFS